MNAVFPKQLQDQNIDGMLYFSQMNSSTVDTLEKEISRMDSENAIHWKDAAGLQRRTFEFGVSFKEIERTGQIVKRDLPDFLLRTREEVVGLFRQQLAEKDPSQYENCIVTLYDKGEGIKPHTDRDYFGPDILGLIVQPDTSSDPDKIPATLCFHKPGTDERIDLSEKRGTAYLIQGDLRYGWTHQLSPVVQQRISIQFRTVIPSKIKVNPNWTY